VAIGVLEVERVAHVGEDHAPDAHLREQRELDLGVADHLHVPADPELSQEGIRGLIGGRLDDRAQ
jgi:hypothetical protein